MRIVLQEGLGYRASHGRKPSWTRRGTMPDEPKEPGGKTHRVLHVPFVNRGRASIQPNEKEALAVVWACEKAHIYLIGHKFLIAVDNRAVQLIYGNAKSKPPARIERWALRLTQFDFTIAHRPGKSNIADYYSRSPGGIGISAYIEEIRSEQYISIVVQSAIPPAMTLREISEATNNDKELCELRKCLKSEKGATKELRQFDKIWNELSLTREGVILRCHRIVIPVKLQERVIELAHGGHQGIVKTKSLLRSRVWLRKMDEMVEKFV